MAELEKLVVRIEADTQQIQKQLKTLEKNLGNTKSQSKALESALVRTAAKGFSVAAVAAFSRSIVVAGMEMQALESRMLAATSSAELSAEAMTFIKRESDRLGLSIVDSSNGFASFSAAALRSGLTMTDTKDVFSAVSEAVTVLKLNTADANLVFNAMSQIAAKGVVSMEEMRQQLGERIPFAMAAMADGMGIAQSELIELISSGELAAKDALPALAKGLRDVTDESVVMASDSLQANMNRLNNAIFELKTSIAQSGLIDFLSDAASVSAMFLKNLQEANTINLGENVNKTNVEEYLDSLREQEELESRIARITERLKQMREDESGNVIGRTRIAIQETILENAEKELEKIEAQTLALQEKAGVAKESAEELRRLNAEIMASGATMVADMGVNIVPDLAGEAAGNLPDASALGIDFDKLDKELEGLQGHFMSREELEIEHLTRRMETLQEFAEMESQLDADQKQKLLDAAKVHADAIVAVEDKMAKDKAKTEEKFQRAVASMREKNFNMAVGIAKDLFAENKAASIALIALEKGVAIARTIMLTQVAAMKARTELPFPLSEAYAKQIEMQGALSVGLIAAQGIAQSASVLSSGGSGGGGAAGSASSSASEVTASTQASGAVASKNVTINLGGRAFISREEVETIVNGILEYENDGGTVRVLN
jgi:tape measure domain-containing protein